MKRLSYVLYVVTIILFCAFSWLFVDANFPMRVLPKPIAPFMYDHRGWIVGVYSILLLLLFFSYWLVLWNIKKRIIGMRSVIILVAATVAILFFSFPGFSYDIFNYIATSKLTFLYKENPYIIMPIEIPNESMLSFMHAANKTALYGPLWIALTGIPFKLGLGNLLLTIFQFKLFVVIFYVILLRLIWRLSGKNLWSLAFFGLNPLVVTETLISSHNDVVMMTFALASYYFLKKNKFSFSFLFLIFSILIKFATLILLPIYVYYVYQRVKQRQVEWKKIFMWSGIAMYIMFLLSPLREEIYSWYLIWPLTFVALSPKPNVFTWISFGFTFGLPFRIAPYLYSLSWEGATPLIKKIVTFIPPFITTGYYAFKKKI